MITVAFLFLSAAFFGASITAYIMDRRSQKKLKLQSDYWKQYWYDHFDEIRQTGLTRDQMERMHALYVTNGKSNDVV